MVQFSSALLRSAPAACDLGPGRRGAALATLSILQFLTESFNTTFGGFAQSAVQNICAQTDDVRISGPISDPNFYAQLLVMLVPSPTTDA
jgi:hypothetical protein